MSPAQPDADDEAQRVEQRVLARLDELGVDYEPWRIDPAHAATADFCRVYDWPPERSANCLVVAGRADPPRYAACMVAATAKLDVNHTVRHWLGVRKASFAARDDTYELTGMAPDGVTPFGLPAELPVLVDGALMGLPDVVVGGGSRGLKLRVPPASLADLPGATVIDGLSRSQA